MFTDADIGCCRTHPISLAGLVNEMGRENAFMMTVENSHSQGKSRLPHHARSHEGEGQVRASTSLT